MEVNKSMKETTKPKAVTIGARFLFALLMLCIFIPASAAVETSDGVSIEDAETVASFYVRDIPTFIADYSEWKDATVEQSTVYYDLDGKKSAYAFNVIENGQYAGYILVSATRNNYPILEFSKGRTPNAITELRSCSETLAKERANERKLVAGKARLLYLGATFYYAEYPLLDATGKVKDNMIVDLTVPVVVDSKEQRMEIPIDENDLLQQQQLKKQEANELWDALEKKMMSGHATSEYPVSTLGLGYIYGVPNYPWYCGCSPTASGMVLGYWDSHGYPDLPIGPDGETLIGELAVAMGTDWPGNGATWPWDIDNGIEDVCEDHGYTNFDASNDYWMTWTEVKDEVDASKPFVISMSNGGTGSGYTTPYGDHSVTCVGYSDYDEDYIFIHDTWDEDSHHYIAYGNWWAAMATWVRP